MPCRPTPPLLHRSAALLAAAALALAFYWSLRFAAADFLYRRDSPEALRRALLLAPGDARLHLRSAELHENPAARLAALETALALNPRDSSAWIELGLRSEIGGSFPKAERCLLEAARIDKTYEPRAALANFYFRRNRPEMFWPWVREALNIAYGDMAPLFRLCWGISEDPGLILERAIPANPKVLSQYLQFLLAASRWDAAVPVAHRLLRHARPEHQPVLLSCCDRLLDAGRGLQALSLWNGMIAARLLPYSPLRPEAGAALTNPTFSLLPLSRGFDWRIPRLEGVLVAREQNTSALRLSFSGKQPERCEPLSQFLFLRPSASYRFRFLYRTSGIRPSAGLRWEIYPWNRPGAPFAASDSLSSENWTAQDLRFTSPPDVTLARLALTYRRALGTTRIEGSLTLRGLSLERSPPP